MFDLRTHASRACKHDQLPMLLTVWRIEALQIVAADIHNDTATCSISRKTRQTQPDDGLMYQKQSVHWHTWRCIRNSRSDSHLGSNRGFDWSRGSHPNACLIHLRSALSNKAL